MDEIAAMVRQRIAENGYTAIGVYREAVQIDSESFERPPFMYTVGLDPELIIVGTAGPVSRPILSELAEKQRDGERLEAGRRVRDVLTGGYELELRAVSSGQLCEWMARACEWHRDEGHASFTALQVVWEDAQHRFPWDDGYDGGEQPLLA